MIDIKENGITLQIDEDGLLADAEVWDEETAKFPARRKGINDLRDEQLSIVKFFAFFTENSRHFRY